ncbi:MAG: hypothetical protein ACR2O4_08700 [Hyphomicrobiaceae bacterium]
MTQQGVQRVTRSTWAHLLGLAALIVMSIPTAAQKQASVCNRDFKTVDGLFKTLKGSEGFSKPAPHGYYVVMSEEKNKAIWTFTIPGHPTHPTVVCRMPVTENGKISIAMDMVCGGKKEDCDKLAAAFRKLNEKIRDQLTATGQKKSGGE